tara:strand:+ start:133 stop:1356 length:1224 start_codon:yes stop_codon:yes gene_type:complete
MATGPDFSKEYPLSDLIQPKDLASYLQFDPREELYNYQGSGLLFDDRYIKMPDGTYGLSQSNEAQDYLNPKSYHNDFYAGNRFIPVREYLNTLAGSKDIGNPEDFIIDATSRMKDEYGDTIDLFSDSSDFHNLDTLVDTYNPYGNFSNNEAVNTELKRQPFSGFFRQYANEPGIEALRYYMGQENPEPFYDLSLEEFQPYRDDESVDRNFLSDYSMERDYDNSSRTLGLYNSDNVGQIGIYDDNLRNRENKPKHTAVHELMHFLEHGYGTAGYTNEPGRYNQRDYELSDDPNFYRKLKRASDVHDNIYALDQLSRSSDNNPFYKQYLSDALSQRSYDEMQNTFNASKAANIRDNYQIVNRPKFDNLSDFPIRGDISYDLKESTNSPGHPSNFNPRGRKGGGLASFML